MLVRLQKPETRRKTVLGFFDEKTVLKPEENTTRKTLISVQQTKIDQQIRTGKIVVIDFA
ncbi:CLUMA_CG009377, isoform A [Clunio marinus]|uniref:CLUMA_CG009377, isoform A n=1 Tax=Clunio marinus TaxID=568069 RepID=A0A1J1I8N3_9DIPT|nr:CLUMA_CG009377, isoform A [Clunio marinus]